MSQQSELLRAQLEQARMLAYRLERLSADSHWAHKASGLRGALLRTVEHLENGEGDKNEETANLDRLSQRGFDILASAAREIPPS